MIKPWLFKSPASGGSEGDETYLIGSGGNDGIAESSALYKTDLTVQVASSSKGYYRFTGIDVPAGSTITSATIEVCAQGATLPFEIRVYAKAADNPAEPSAASEVWSATLTTEYATWSEASSWTGSNWKTSPSLVDVIQEIVDRAGWAEGNAIMLIFVRQSGMMTNWAYESSSSYAAKLNLEWT